MLAVQVVVLKPESQVAEVRNQVDSTDDFQEDRSGLGKVVLLVGIVPWGQPPWRQPWRPVELLVVLGEPVLAVQLQSAPWVSRAYVVVVA